MKILTKIKTNSLKKFNALLLAALLLMLSALPSCNCACNKSAKGLQIYQPNVLRVEAGQRIKTCDGFYVTQGSGDCSGEKFYSEKEYTRVLNLLNYK